jgi:uncharacterized protein YjdB
VVDATTGGVSFTSSNTSVATVGVTSGVVTGVTAGTTIITYTINTGCISTAEFTINPAPAPITGSANLCIGSASSLSSTTTGGTWSISNIGRANLGSATGIITGTSLGTANVTYTTAAGCKVAAQITVNSMISAGTISGASSLIVGGSTTLTSTMAGGIWSSSDGTIASVGAVSGIVTGSSAGLATVTYTVTNGCGTATATQGLTVSTSRPGDVNENSFTQIRLYPNPTTGVFTIEAPVNGALSIFDVTGKQAAMFDVNKGLVEITMPRELAKGTYICHFTGEDGSTTVVRLILE